MGEIALLAGGQFFVKNKQVEGRVLHTKPQLLGFATSHKQGRVRLPALLQDLLYHLGSCRVRQGCQLRERLLRAGPVPAVKVTTYEPGPLDAGPCVYKLPATSTYNAPLPNDPTAKTRRFRPWERTLPACPGCPTPCTQDACAPRDPRRKILGSLQRIFGLVVRISRRRFEEFVPFVAALFWG